jgi:hypothetical protein
MKITIEEQGPFYLATRSDQPGLGVAMEMPKALEQIGIRVAPVQELEDAYSRGYAQAEEDLKPAS